MKKIVYPRVLFAIVCALFFTLLGTTIENWQTARIVRQEIEEKHFYETANIIDYLNAEFTAEDVCLDETHNVTTTFSRKTPFEITAEQVLTLRAFCDGASVVLYQREPINLSVSHNDGERTDIDVSYNLYDMNIGDVENVENCEFIISKDWNNMNFPYGVKRSMELKTEFKVYETCE